MILEIIERWVKTSRYKYKGKRILTALYKCDACGKIEELPYRKGREKHLRVCSPECDSQLRSRGGKLYNNITSTNVDKYGEIFASKTNLCKEKQRQTNIERYGCESTSQNIEVQKKRHSTCMKRYGGPAPTSDPRVREKVRATCIRKFGGGHLLDPELRRRFNNTMRSKYGCDWAVQNKEIRAKQYLTNIKRYGVIDPRHSVESKRKCASLEVAQKRHETMKRNKSYGKSKPEDRLYEVLCEIFGVDDVERQKTVERWPIDFYVKSIDTYVQYDSYWHGVGRDINEIAEYKNKRDVMIHKKMLTDIKQNAYFLEHRLKLVRVLGLQIREITVDSIKTLMGLL
jgi:hypothetical protein